jgi:carbonic anhydrase
VYLETNKLTIKILNIMKTRIFSLIAIAAVVLGVSNTTLAATKDSAANSEVSTVLKVSKINKIEVRGNVELYVTDGADDQVKVYNRYYSESALIQNNNGTLRISSFADQKLVVWVKAEQLSSIAAYDNAEIKSFGKISPLEMEVTLYDNAYAKLDVNGYSMDITVNNRAKADLSGSVDQCNLKYDRSAYVNSTDFAAAHITRTVEGSAKNEDFVGL